MTTIVEARFQIEARLVELAAGADRAPLVASVQAERDGNDVLVFVHLTDDDLNGGCPLVTTVTWTAAAFDENEFIQAFWAAGPPSTVRN